MVRILHRDLSRSFELDKKLRLDPELRAAAEKMSADHLARIQKLLPAWLEEERKLQTAKGEKLSPNELYYAVWARLLNELALWQIEPGDTDYEQATLAVLKTSPRVCELEGDGRFSDFSSRMMRLQAMPAAQRTAALATERQLLAHWGQARTTVAPWPDPLPQDAAMLLIKRAPADGQQARLPLPPMLASTLLGQQKDYASLAPVTRCAFQQWWLQESLRQGAKPADALNAFRYGTLITASARFVAAPIAQEREPKPGAATNTPPYPPLARRFLVTGKTYMRIRFNAEGKPEQASVEAREIKVEGIRGVRPVAFESIFDKLSVDYALEERRYDIPNGAQGVRIQLVWNLDESAKTAAAAPKGSDQ